MSSDPYTALIVLTAGRSSRMGESKALLRFGKRTALELAVDNAVSAGVRRVVAVVGHRNEEIRAAHSFSGLPLTFQWAVNLRGDSPMIASLQVGLRAIAGIDLDAFLFQPIDVPLITGRDLRLLTGAFASRSRGETVFIASHDNHRGHPVLCNDQFSAPGDERRNSDPASGSVTIRKMGNEGQSPLSPNTGLN